MTPLTLFEARAILLAHKALDLSYEARLSTGDIFGIDEFNAWHGLVRSARERVESYEAHSRRISEGAPRE